MPKTVYVFEPTLFRQYVEDSMKKGAREAGMSEPRFSFFEDYIGIVHASGEMAADVVIAAHANGNGRRVIEELQSIERHRV